MAGIVTAVSRSAAHMLSKLNEDEIRLLVGLGVEGDAHSGATVKHRSRLARFASEPNLRQIHLIHAELHAAFIIPGALCTVIGIALFCCVHGGQVVAAPVDRRPDPPVSRRDVIRTFIVLSFTMLADGTISQAVPVALPKVFAEGIGGLTDGGTLDAGGFVTLVFLVAATAQLAGGWLADRFVLKSVYILAWAVQAPLFFAAAQARDLSLLATMMAVNYLGVLATPAENALLARYTPARWRATAYRAKFLLALGVSTIGVKLVAMTYDRTGSFTILWLALAGCAAFVVLAGIFLPRGLRHAPLLAPQPAE